MLAHASMEPCASQPDVCDAVGILPRLLLVGTRKGGTTALSSLLREHPAVVMPNCSGAEETRRQRLICWWDKEVRFFSRGGKVGVDLCWYRSLYAAACSGNGGGNGLVLILLLLLLTSSCL